MLVGAWDLGSRCWSSQVASLRRGVPGNHVKEGGREGGGHMYLREAPARQRKHSRPEGGMTLLCVRGLKGTKAV